LAITTVGRGASSYNVAPPRSSKFNSVRGNSESESFDVNGINILDAKFFENALGI